jgi:hypothetical protein
MKGMKATYILISGEGTSEGTKRTLRATALGIKRILTKERCGGDRWAKAYYRMVSTQNIWINAETGESREF